MKWISSVIMTLFCVCSAWGQDANTAAEPDITAERLARAPEMKIVLPDPNFRGTISIESSIVAYQQTQSFLTTPLNDAQIGQVMWAANMTIRSLARIQTTRSASVTKATPQTAEKASPSPLLFPYELYVFNQNGIFKYDPLTHSLSRTGTRDFRLGLSNAANKMPAITQAAATILVLTRPQGQVTSRSKFNEYAQAGQIAQSVSLQAAGLGLGAFITTTFDQSLVRRIAAIPATQDAICMISVGVPVKPLVPLPAQTQQRPLTKPRVAIVLPEKNYNDQELSDILDALEIADIESEIASTTLGSRLGMNKGRATATVTVNDLILQNYNAIIFIGGNGMTDYYRNNNVLNLIQTANNQGMIIAGIGEGAALMGRAGILAPELASEYARQSQYRLGNDQSYGETGIQSQAGIITAAGPLSSTVFARSIIQALRGETAAPLQPEVTRPSPRIRFGGPMTGSGNY